jgi:F-type H+-transporting ATPase subunit b
MNTLFNTLIIAEIREGVGGLFDFNATLPLIALQFVLLTVLLTFIFYKPIAQVLDQRETFINTNLTLASEKLLRADELYEQYSAELKKTRSDAQASINESKKEAKIKVTNEVREGNKFAAFSIDTINKEFEAQKRLTVLELETKVDELSQLITTKLLGNHVVL